MHNPEKLKRLLDVIQENTRHTFDNDISNTEGTVEHCVKRTRRQSKKRRSQQYYNLRRTALYVLYNLLDFTQKELVELFDMQQSTVSTTLKQVENNTDSEQLTRIKDIVTALHAWEKL